MVAAAPLRLCCPSGEEAGDTNQLPGVVRLSDWGLTETRWPLPRGRLGGGSARAGRPSLGQGGRTLARLDRASLRKPRAVRRPPASSPLLCGLHGRLSPASPGSDLSFISEAVVAAATWQCLPRKRVAQVSLLQLAGTAQSKCAGSTVSQSCLPYLLNRASPGSAKVTLRPGMQ